MKCKYGVKFCLVQTISLTIFYMRNFITFYIHTRKHIIYYYGHLIDLGYSWSEMHLAISFILNGSIHLEIVAATAAKRKLLWNIKLWNGNVQLVSKHKWDAEQKKRTKKFQNHVKIKMFNIYFHRKWIYCIFIKLNETKPAKTRPTNQAIPEQILWKKCVFQNVLYIAILIYVVRYTCFMMPINFGRSQSNCFWSD